MKKHTDVFVQMVLILIMVVVRRNQKKVRVFQFMFIVICTADHFQCSNSLCIDKNKQCDGSIDCIDKSDELNCPIGKNLTKTLIFSMLKRRIHM